MYVNTYVNDHVIYPDIIYPNYNTLLIIFGGGNSSMSLPRHGRVYQKKKSINFILNTHI